jgi:hypothetical protein
MDHGLRLDETNLRMSVHQIFRQKNSVFFSLSDLSFIKAKSVCVSAIRPIQCQERSTQTSMHKLEILGL